MSDAADKNSQQALLFSAKADRFIRLVSHHLAFLKDAGGYGDCRIRSGGSSKQFIPFNTAVEVADALIFNLLHGVELELKAALINATKEFPTIHVLSKLIEALRNTQQSQELLCAIDKCLDAIKQCVGPAAGVGGGNTITLQKACIDTWYGDMRYPERKKSDGVRPDLFQFHLTTDEQWQRIADAVENLQKVTQPSA